MSQHYYIDESNSGILIHGDNFAVLRAMRDKFRNSIKCIYIDPPYNSNCNFSYFNDSFEESQWLEMMEPRLNLMWEYLSDDGSFWISIDDSECHYLKVLCDRLFDRKSFVATIVREKNDAPRNQKHRIAHMHDYLLVYAKHPETCQINSVSFDSLLRYSKLDEHSAPWIPFNLIQRAGSNKGRRDKVLINGEEYEPQEGYEWSLDLKTIQSVLKEGLVEILENVPVLRRYKEKWGKVPPTTLWLNDWVDSNQEARHEICELFQNEFFYAPKPERLLSRIIEIATNPGDIVLDAFLGTGTTAAVAHKMGRKWIGIEIGSQCEEYCLPRLDSVIRGYDQGGVSKLFDWSGGGQFQYFNNVGELKNAELCL